MAETIRLVAIFLVLVAGLWIGRQQWIAVVCGILAAAVLFGIGPGAALRIAGESVASRLTVTTLLAFYTITYLQRMLEARGQIDLAQRSLAGIFNHRRINTALAPIIIGMLPSAGAVTICGAIVDKATGDHFKTEEKTFVTSYFRHIPEALLPTYPSIIIGLQLTGVPFSRFFLGMVPMIAALILLGYLFYLRRLPADTGVPHSVNKKRDALNLAWSLWSIALGIGLVIAAELPVFEGVGLVILLNILVNRFRPGELGRMAISAFETKTIVTTALILVFKDVIIETGAMNSLPDAFARLPFPLFFTYFLLFLFGTLLVGQQAISAIGLPLAFANVPGAGMPLFVLLMSCGYAAMQISPTHVCLAVVTGYFKTSFGDLVRRTLPVVGVFLVILLGYYLLLMRFAG
jgi:integral membrane protein (TIGR00529 family)